MESPYCNPIPSLGTLDIEYQHEGHRDEQPLHYNNNLTLYDILYRT